MSRLFIFALIIIGLLFSGCSRKSRYYSGKTYKITSKPRTYSSSTSDYNSYISEKEYKYAKMNSYRVLGKRYYPQKVSVGDRFEGIASWYGPDFHAKLTANGETYNMYDMTAAHKTLPMNTMLKVTNRRNGLSAIVRINDRGPFVGTRIIDLSNAAARKIDMVGTGTASVRLEVLGFYSKNRVKTRKVKVVHTPKKKVPKSPAKRIDTYALQIASFTNIEGAIKVQEDHNNTDGYTTVIKDIETDHGRFFKVYLRGFKTQKEIRDYKSNGNFKNSFIVKDN
ncbi:MAG: septal ring lytic transglycosylase RlpA family protein [Sulfurimonas sp.]|nr:septal ring lytic transglycosylase RlpA family protein [Sulfurimonas sp.]MDQ7061493.1 septal ring lytic transglycosylase RlpA family protein [Sulfurimonas sp.]